MAKTGGYNHKLAEVTSLSEDRAKAVGDFATYLRARMEQGATAEILSSKDLVQQLKKSRKAWTDWEEGVCLTRGTEGEAEYMTLFRILGA